MSDKSSGAFRDRCREVARGERGPGALLAESCADLARSLAAEHALSMEEAPMKSSAIALAVVLCAAHLGQLVLLDADARFVLASLAMLGPTLLFLLAMARPAWPLRLAAINAPFFPLGGLMESRSTVDWRSYFSSRGL